MSEKRILITGSRNWTDRAVVARAIRSAATGAGIATVVHGAARGADSIAAEIAEGLGLHVEAHPARWDLHGRAAGPIRNREMVEAGALLCLAFPLGRSVGTRHCMKLARAAGILVVDHEPAVTS